MTLQAALFSLQDSFPLVMAESVALTGGNGGDDPAPIPIQDSGVDLVRKTVCIKVRLSTMGNTRKVSTAHVEVDADKDLLRVSKHLLDSAELKALGRFDG
jgi:hypothetical protein